MSNIERRCSNCLHGQEGITNCPHASECFAANSKWAPKKEVAMREITGHLVLGLPANRQLRVFAEERLGAGGAPIIYEVASGEVERTISGGFQFSYGGGKKNGDAYFQDWLKFQDRGVQRPEDVNGLTDEALLAIVIDRLECFQAGPYPCPQNDLAIRWIKDALKALKNRTEERIRRGVEGKEEK